MKAIVLAAGDGSNLAPFSLTKPKAMAHVAGRPILHRTLSMLRESGFSEAYMVVGRDGKAITDYFGSGRDVGMTISYLAQKRPTGIGDAILAAKGKFVPGEHFLLVYSDVIAEENMASSVMQAFFLTDTPSASICLTDSSGDFGNVYLDGAMNITRIVEKPGGKGMGNYVLAGMYVLPHDFFGILERCGGDMARGLASLIRDGGLKGSIWEKGWLDVVHPWDILTANRMAMDKWHHSETHESVKIRDAHIKGPVRIEEDVEIRSGAVIEGPAFIGRGSYVGNNALVRKYSSVGSGCVVGFGVELKNCVLCDGVRVGRLSFVGDSVVGEGAEIGSGTMTINSNMDGSTVRVVGRGGRVDSGMAKLGAFVGDGARVGSGHNLAPGSVVAPGEVVPHHLTHPGRGRR